MNNEKKFEHGEIEPTPELKAIGDQQLRKLQPKGPIPRCAKCRRMGKTNTAVVAIASYKTKDAEQGDFLCIFHNDITAVPLPDSAKAHMN